MHTCPWRVYFRHTPLNTTWCTSTSQQHWFLIDVAGQRLFILLSRIVPHHVPTLPVVEVSSSVVAQTPASTQARATGVIVVFLMSAAVAATIVVARFFLASTLTTTSLPLLFHE
jgi:hypothetical protein